MATKVQKWGNSLAVRIPDEIVEDVGLAPGKEVTVRSERDRVVIVPISRKKRPTLAEIVARIKPEHLHEEIDWCEPMGKEIW